MLASSTGHSQILSRSCGEKQVEEKNVFSTTAIKSGSGLRMRLTACKIKNFQNPTLKGIYYSLFLFYGSRMFLDINF